MRLDPDFSWLIKKTDNSKLDYEHRHICWLIKEKMQQLKTNVES